MNFSNHISSTFLLALARYERYCGHACDLSHPGTKAWGIFLHNKQLRPPDNDNSVIAKSDSRSHTGGLPAYYPGARATVSDENDSMPGWPNIFRSCTKDGVWVPGRAPIASRKRRTRWGAEYQRPREAFGHFCTGGLSLDDSLALR
jgi:hypothetical protein